MNHLLTAYETAAAIAAHRDYLVVEDFNINGHPVLAGFGPGGMRVIEAYKREFRGDYHHDVARGQS